MDLTMGIASLSTSLAAMNTSTAVGMKVLELGKDLMEQTGAQTVEMMKQMELSVNPNLGSNIDISI